MARLKMPEDFNLTGDKAAVLLLHAYTGTTADIRLVAGALNRAGYDVTGFNFAGHATFDPTNILINGNPNLWEQQAIEHLQAIQQKFGDNVFVFGLSLGGIYAMDLLEKFPNLRGGGVFSSPIMRGDDINSSNLINSFFEYAQIVQSYDQNHSDGEKQEKMTYLHDHLREQLDEIRTFQLQVRQNLAAITAPIFIAQGDQDEIIDANLAKELSQNLPNAKSVDLKWYQGASHVLTTNTAKKDLINDVLQFITEN